MCFHPLKTQSNSKDLSLIPSRREKDEDPEDEGGKALHVHYSTPTPCRDVVLSPWLRLDWSPRSQLGRPGPTQLGAPFPGLPSIVRRQSNNTSGFLP